MALALKTNLRLWAVTSLAITALLSVLLATVVGRMSSPVTLKPRAAVASQRYGASLSELPVSLGQAASEVFGRAHVGYWLKPARGGGFAGVNPARGLRLRSEAMGIELAGVGATHVRLALARATAGGSRFDLSHVVACVKRNQLVYDAGAVREYFVNGPLGVEQRFSIARAPAAATAQIDLVIDVSGAHASLLPDDMSARLATGRGVVVRYAGLKASDSSGRPLRARMRLRGGQLVLAIEARGARFPVTVDPLLSPYAMLTGPAEVTSRFGSSVALSADGSTAVIGGEGDDGGFGALWVFTKSGSSWTQQGPKLTPQGSGRLAPSNVKSFGSSVAISRDGNTILVGDGRFGGPLAAWVFRRSNGVWSQQGAPLSPRAPRGEPTSGSENIALSGDGRTAAFRGTIASTYLVWVYAWSHGRWREQAPPPNAPGGNLALSANGSTLLIGTASYLRVRSRWRAAGLLPTGPGEYSDRSALSADGRTAVVTTRPHRYALIYTRSRRHWITVAKLTSPRPEAALSFAEGVALSANGSTALVGASPPSEAAGAKSIAYLFTRTSDNNWAATAALAMNRPWLAAVSADGTTVVAPPPLREEFERIVEQGGPARVLVRTGSGWSEQAALSPNDATGVDSRGFGEQFALSADGSTALVSEDLDTAWIFNRTGDAWARQARLHLEGTRGGGLSVALSADGNTAVLAGPSAPGPVAAWAFSRAGGSWSAHGTPMIAAGMGPRPPGSELELESFASSVAVSANGEFILVGAAWDSGRTGAAWVFARSGSGWVQQGQKLTPSSPSSEERFGEDVALSGDGAVALIGAVGDIQHPPEGSGPQGAAFAFVRSGSTWSQTAKLIDSELHRYETTREVGRAVALSADGNTALLGTRRSVLVFTKAPTGWQQHRPLTPSGLAGSSRYSGEVAFGDVLALSASGDQALVSGIPTEGCGKYMNDPCSAPSVVWAFDRAGETWLRQPSPLVAGRSVGGHLALSGNGELALIRGVTPGPEPGGAVFVSHLTPPPQSGFVIEPIAVEYEGVLELALWTPAPATLKATARVISPGTRRAHDCAHPPRVKRPTPRRSCSVRTVLYGSTSAKGVENVRLSITPRPRLVGFLERHKRVRVAITISDQPSPPTAPSTQTIDLTVRYIRTPPPEY